MRERLFYIFILLIFILLLPFTVNAVSVPYITTFDCAEWEHTGASGPDCDSLSVASDSRKGTKITTSANHPGGDGGRGLRQYLGDGTNNQTSGLSVSYDSQDEIWIRWYMRYESGFTWTGNWPGYDKWLYIDSGQSDCVIPEYDGNEVNLYSCVSINNKDDTADWRSIMGGLTGDGQWHYYEIHVKQAGSSGVGEMWIDGVRYLNWTNTNYGSSTFSRLVIGSNCMTPSNGSSGSASSGTLTNAGYVDFDDVEISSTGYIGPISPGSDTTPPTTSNHSPAKSATDVDVDENIVFQVTDAGDGVDGTTIELTVEGTVYCCSDGTCTNKTLGRSGSAPDYTIIYTHVYWEYDQIINVEINADDLAQNSMSADIYSFTTKEQADIDPPTPNPMTWSSSPSNASASSISMTSTTGSDATGPVMYSFEYDIADSGCSSDGGTGGSTSEWQIPTGYTDSGLQANKCYGYTVQARDGVPITPNIGTTSSVSATYTSASIAGAPTLSGPTNTTLDIANDASGNPSSNPTTDFNIQCTSASPSDATWLNKYVDASGNPSATAIWLSDATWDAITVAGLNASTTYGFKSQARNEDGDTASQSSEGQGTTAVGPESDAPTPDPMTWAVEPAGASTTSISMTSTTGADASPPIEYYFDYENEKPLPGDDPCFGVDGNNGSDSGWQSADTTYTDTGLTVNQCYKYRVQAKDTYGNVGTASSFVGVFTLANTPGAPTLSGPTNTTLNLVNDANGNPWGDPQTKFAIQCVSVDGAGDASWLNKWVELAGAYPDYTGTPANSEDWLSDGYWDNTTITGLTPGLKYGFKVKARNGDFDVNPTGTGVATSLSSEGQGTTTTGQIDMTIGGGSQTITIGGGGQTITW